MSMNVGLGNHQALEEKERMKVWTEDLYGEQELHVFERDFWYESMEQATLIKHIKAADEMRSRYLSLIGND